jgi:hypothetical protein
MSVEKLSGDIAQHSQQSALLSSGDKCEHRRSREAHVSRRGTLGRAAASPPKLGRN